MRHHEEQRPAPRDEDAAARQHAVPLHQVLGAARGHDAGQRPARERHRPVVRPRREDQRLGRDALGLILSGQRDDALIEDAPDDGAERHLHPERPHLVDEPPALGGLLAERGAAARRAVERAKPGGHLAIVLPAELRILVDEEDADPVAGRRPGRRQPGRAAPDHHALDRSHCAAPQSPSPRCISTRSPSRTGVMQARTLGRPSTVSRQSWQTPMPQK